MAGRGSFSFAIISDTHVRPEGGDRQAGYPSDARHNLRNRRVVALLRALAPELVIHLGDVTHSLPTLGAYKSANKVARRIFNDLDCPFHVAPGNHDVGDKQDAPATAPKVSASSLESFQGIWGSTWCSFQHGPCHFVLLNSSLLGSGLEAERRQREWLERELQGKERIFLFMHYPPYLFDPDEPSHYDNLALPGRTWFLGILRRFHVEAVFTGHVHNYFHNRYQGTHVYVLPSTAFVRPEYSELYPVAPGPENGRDDRAKLGFFMVHVDSAGFRVDMYRSAMPVSPFPGPTPASALGVWLPGGWARAVDLPCGDLDPFQRKWARTDESLLALEEMGFSRFRLALGDLNDPLLRDRLELLRSQGASFTFFSTCGEPRHLESGRGLLQKYQALVDLWEIVVLPSLWARVLPTLEDCPVPVALSRVQAPCSDPTGYFSHFLEQGFGVEEPLPHQVVALPGAVTHLVFRIPRDLSPWDGIDRARNLAETPGLRALCHVELPRSGEQSRFRDDVAIAGRVAEAMLAAAANPGVMVFLDTFMDKDRGYFPHDGLVDRRFNPRSAARVLRNLARLLHGSEPPLRQGPGDFAVSAGLVQLRPSGPGHYLDLDSGYTCRGGLAGPALLLPTDTERLQWLRSTTIPPR